MKRIIRTVLALVLVSGCGTIRGARKAQREAGESLPAGERSLSLAEMGLTHGQMLTLGNAVDISLQWHPSMLNATQLLESARISVRQAGVNMRPGVSSSAGFSDSHNRSNLNDWDTQSSYSMSVGLSLSWVLCDFGRTRAAQRQAAAQYIAAGESYRDAGVQRIAQVRNAYFSFARAKALCTVAEESLRQYQLLLEQAELKLKIGTGKRYDVTKASVDCSNAALSLINASNAVVTAQANLNSQLGLAEPVVFEIEPFVELPDIAGDLPYLLGVAHTNQPSMRMQNAKVNAASAAVDMAIANLYPSINVSANASYNTSHSSGGATAKSFSWGWGPSFVQSLFSGWGRTDAVRQNVTSLRIARANLAQQEQKILGDLTTALANLNAAREAKATSEKLLGQARENLDIVTEQFDIGMSSILERTDAQLTHTQAAANLVTTQYALEIAKANLYAILGLY